MSAPSAEPTETAVAEAGRAATARTSQDPDPLLTPLPEAPGEDAVAGADALKAELTEHSGTVGSIIDRLDAFGFTIGDTRVSLWSVLVVILVIVCVILAARIATRLGSKLMRRLTRLSPSQELLGEKMVTIGVWALAFFLGIDLLGIDLTALAVFSGAFGLAIGFGLQKTFGNLIAGIILLMDRSIKPGDVIAVSDGTGRESFGQIRKIGVRAISVVTRDKKEYLIPNENLMVNQVENWSYSSRDVRVKAPVGVAYDTDLELAEKLMCQAASAAPRVLKTPKPRVLLMGFGESSIDFEIRFWIVDPEEGVSGVRSDVYKTLWRLFRENGIEIPFPQRDLNLRDNEQYRQLIAALTHRTAPPVEAPRPVQQGSREPG
jgi:small-conductance mechanosensitive channel